jgi:hypothetical protein
MKLSELKKAIPFLEQINFYLPDGSSVPAHFHVTEIGKVRKDYIDCGGTIRSEEVVSMQLWQSIDFHHRLKPDKLLQIIQLTEDKLQIGDHEIEVEYQADTIGKYALQFKEGKLVLSNKQTACLASDACGITDKVKVKLGDLKKATVSCCEPGSGCC